MTKPSFSQMNALMATYEGKDLVLLAFPCADFMNQEPYDENKPDELLNEIKYVRPGGGFEHKVTQFFKKVHVNGADETPVYRFMKDSCPVTTDALAPLNTLNYAPVRAKDINWNYEKFLIAKDGSVYTRYSPTAFMPQQISPDIDVLLAQ